mmetsp:Transcript_8206/g.24694  ORF Transcript_8206/g.24694 Transcript_8206/m.24694 type:complete len:244 (+) Transcript_8206:51-782(+)
MTPSYDVELEHVLQMDPASMASFYEPRLGNRVQVGEIGAEIRLLKEDEAVFHRADSLESEGSSHTLSNFAIPIWPKEELLVRSESRSESRSKSRNVRCSGDCASAEPSKYVSAEHDQPKKKASRSSRTLKRTFPCPWSGCELIFKKRDHVQSHMRQHTGETPYHCPVKTCSLQFKWRSSLRNHMRYHTEIPTSPIITPRDTTAAQMSAQQIGTISPTLTLGSSIAEQQDQHTSLCAERRAVLR